jgi:hypothetical protein
MLSGESLEDDRVLPGTPLDGLLQILKRKANAQVRDIDGDSEEEEGRDDDEEETL